MEYRLLGRTGVPISVLSLGSWVTFGRQVDENLAIDMIKLAYDHGINFFDNAEVYGRGRSEVIMGEALKRLELPRDGYMVSSKVFFGYAKEPLPTQKGLHRKHIIEACHQALQRLQLDYLDLYFCHRPDPQTPIEEIVWSMNILIQQGKILFWGTSEWSAQQILYAHLICERHHLIPPVMEQPQYNLLVRDRVENEYAFLYQTVQLGTTIWSPLASGLLTAKYVDHPDAEGRLNLPGFEWIRDRYKLKERGEEMQELLRQFKRIAEEQGTTPARLAIAWCLKNPHVSTVILGASRLSQLKENLDALEDYRNLDDETYQTLTKLFEPFSDIPRSLRF
jgi:voltage-dependent potassium channel beta subunit